MPKRRRPAKSTVAVTGAAGYVAGRLIENLCADDDVERILGFDVRDPEVTHAKFVFDPIDVRSPALEKRLAGVDVVVHLAFVMDPIKDEALMRDVNVNGSQNVLRAAGRAGVRKVIYTSSATVYGAHPDNDFPLTEDSPLRANLDFSYPAHKLEVEYVVKEFREEFPKTVVTVFRPAIVFGPSVDNAWSHFLEMPVIFGVKGHSPPFQFVHEDDVGRALVFAVSNDLDGPFNLAPDDWIEADDVLAVLGKKRVDVPEPTAFALSDRLWALGMAEAPAGMLHYVMHPWVVSADKLATVGFRCERSSMQAFSEVAEAARNRLRFGRRAVRRADLVRGAAAGAGVMGAAATYALVRWRRAAS
jgi:UDP-glucose 4-epimerase